MYFSYFKVDPNHGSEFETWPNIESMIGPNHMIRRSLGMHKILLKNLRLKVAFAVELKSGMFKKFLYF